ncbi:hypothetical protein AWY96_01365 [Serratia plymuthica]|uniref:enolase C-terminal domain-like protein n=1 Tax=Serratia plymuthica TaxID=82996 RepID=UPI0007A0ABA0|nr:enolase C-terminal domain-like protein [Serratia plymuthica]KYQ97219.1 hypothetical protein AWY96_01365 [Serratia plymuthica]
MKIEFYKVNQPMINVFEHAESGRSCSDSIILSFFYKGIDAIGECAPRRYVTNQTTDDVIQELKNIEISELIKEICLDSFEDSIIKIKSTKLSESLCTNCILEISLLDWIGKKHNRSLWEILNIIKNKSEVFDNFKVTEVMDLSISPDKFLRERGPFHTVKIKVRNNISEAINRVSFVREKLGNSIKIILDANMCWTLNTAIENIKKISEYNIDYYEEPLKKGSFDEYRILRQAVDCNIMLDETVCSIDDLLMAIRLKSCDAINIRISKNGGILSAIKMIDICRNEGMAYQIGAQVAEVGPLICAGRHLRAISDDALTFEGGQPDRWFDAHIIEPMPLVNRDKNIAYRMNGRGLGCSLTHNFKYRGAHNEGN